MFNPLINVSSISLSELETGTIDLQRKYFQTHNPILKQQIAVVIDMYKEELYNRRAEEAEKQRQQSGIEGLDTLININ